MLPILLRIIAVGIGGWIVKEIVSSDNKKKRFANTHLHFLLFEQNISVTKSKIQKLITSRRALQKRITEFFKTQKDAPIPKFYIQGSYKMGTMILAKDGTYDVDLGVYFLTKPNITSATLQKWVFDAVSGHTSGGAEHREKCIRVIYSGDFDIDLPVYYKTYNDNHPFLATKNKWFESDPKELCDWFESKKDKNGQVERLVKYFKAWANNQPRKMPSGIAFTVWVAKYYVANKRDDRSFFETAKAIHSSFVWEVASENPATPRDNFLTKLSSSQKQNFSEAFNGLIEACGQALKQEDMQLAISIWAQQFGNRFK